MVYITDLLRGTIEPVPDRITPEVYVQESAFVTRYLSRVVRDKALVVYHVLFHLSWFETGKGEITVPWAQVGSFIRSEQGNIINNTTVKRRPPDLVQQKCIAINRQRATANEIFVYLPSDIPSCKELIDQEKQESLVELQETDERDYYTDTGRRRAVLMRDKYACVYCTVALSEENFVLDHLVPVARGRTNRKHNLIAACEVCNRHRGESDPVQFLRENYRQQTLTQEEFLGQKDYVEALLEGNAG